MLQSWAQLLQKGENLEGAEQDSVLIPNYLDVGKYRGRNGGGQEWTFPPSRKHMYKESWWGEWGHKLAAMIPHSNLSGTIPIWAYCPVVTTDGALFTLKNVWTIDMPSQTGRSCFPPSLTAQASVLFWGPAAPSLSLGTQSTASGSSSHGRDVKGG